MNLLKAILWGAVGVGLAFAAWFFFTVQQSHMGGFG
jgi:hypothetical protein